MNDRFKECCEQREDLCHCTADDEFEAMLEEPEEQLARFASLSRPQPSTVMIRPRIAPHAVPRRLRRPMLCWGCS